MGPIAFELNPLTALSCILSSPDCTDYEEYISQAGF